MTNHVHLSETTEADSAEIDQLLRAAEHLSSPTGLRAQTYVAAFGLLAVSGYVRWRTGRS